MKWVINMEGVENPMVHCMPRRNPMVPRTVKIRHQALWRSRCHEDPGTVEIQVSWRSRCHRQDSLTMESTSAKGVVIVAW